MNTNIPMSDEIFKKCTFFWGEELLKWRKCLQCDEIWSNISNRIMRGRVGPYGGQEQLLLKSDENILNVMKYIWLNINNRIIRGRVGTITPINKMVKWKGGMCRSNGRSTSALVLRASPSWTVTSWLYFSYSYLSYPVLPVFLQVTNFVQEPMRVQKPSCRMVWRRRYQ